VAAKRARRAWPGEDLVMNAQRKRQRSTENMKQEDRSSGVYLIAPAGRVARRGSTRLEPSSPAEPMSIGRGRSRHGNA
jgi:hypothetical protein